MRSIHYIATLVLATVLACANAVSSYDSSLDAPHNSTNGVSCGDCHYISTVTPPFWSSVVNDADDVPENNVCWNCHNDVTAEMMETHGSVTLGNKYSSAAWPDTTGLFGGWTVRCITCHSPHDQKQFWSFGAEASLVSGYVDSAEAYNSAMNQTRLTLIPVVGKTSEWASNRWKGYIFFTNTAHGTFSFQIESCETDSQGNRKLTVRGDATHVVGVWFYVLYGKMINSSVDGRYVKFFGKPGDGTNYSYIDNDGNQQRTGICETCHTQTHYFAYTDNKQTRHAYSIDNGSDCMRCHYHGIAFKYPGPIPPPCLNDVDCGTAYFCEKPVGNCNSSGICAPLAPETICPSQVQAVCGCDGNAYINACEAVKIGVNINQNGACETISISDASVNETTGLATFTVSLVRASTSWKDVSFHYITRDNTALAVADYEKTFGKIKFQPNSTTALIKINIFDDVLYEGAETFQAVIQPTTEGVATSDDTGVCTIKDDDIPDLVVGEITGPASARQSETIPLTLIVSNINSKPAPKPFSTGIYISKDSAITSDDHLLGEIAFDRMEANSSSAWRGTLAMPSRIIDGIYYIGAAADIHNQLLETDKTNNSLGGNAMTITNTVSYANTIAITHAVYDSAAKQLAVRATSSYGFSAGLVLDGFGAMTWIPDKAWWEIRINGIEPANAPPTVSVTGPEGNATAGVTAL
ncbi:MAG: hypothetical protein HZA20_01835 [Nitrospirae bacterium]|nr:hypothetical protein [Nitrospirota bacterium]